MAMVILASIFDHLMEPLVPCEEPNEFLYVEEMLQIFDTGPKMAMDTALLLRAGFVFHDILEPEPSAKARHTDYQLPEAYIGRNSFLEQRNKGFLQETSQIVDEAMHHPHYHREYGRFYVSMFPSGSESDSDSEGEEEEDMGPSTGKMPQTVAMEPLVPCEEPTLALYAEKMRQAVAMEPMLMDTVLVMKTGVETLVVRRAVGFMMEDNYLFPHADRQLRPEQKSNPKKRKRANNRHRKKNTHFRQKQQRRPKRKPHNQRRF